MKKKILFIITSLGGGGAEKVLITTLKNFDYSRFEVHLCMISKWGLFINDLPKEVKVFYLYEDPNSLYTKVSFNLYSRFRISTLEKMRIRSVVDKSYDTIISFTEGRTLKFHGYIVNRAKRNVTWVHTNMFNNHYTIGDVLSAKDEEATYRSMDCIVFVSNDAKTQFQKLYKIENEQIVILNPIERESIIEMSKLKEVEKSKFIIGSVGRLCKEKAFDRLVRVAAMVRDSGYDVEFWILGEGDKRELLESEIKRLHLEETVKLLGFHNPPYPYLAKFDIFLSTSLVEGYPLVVAEAFCLGVPVVATKCTGNIELLDNGRYGILTENSDESIYNGIKRLISSNTTLQHYQTLSQIRAKSFNVKDRVNQIMEAIK